MILYAFIAFAARFSFAGGFDHLLIESIFNTVDKPVVAIAYDLKPRAKIEFDWKSQEDLRAKLKNLTGYESKVGGAWGFSRGTWPIDYFRFNDREEYLRPFRFLGSKLVARIENEKISIRTTKGPVQVADLEGKVFSKQAKFHWFYKSLYITAFCNSADESEVLKSLADALGAKLYSNDGEHIFEFNPITHRARVCSMFRRAANNEMTAALRADYQYSDAVYSSLTDAQLRTIYSSAKGELKIPLSNALLAAVGARFEARYGLNGCRVPQLDPSTQAAYAWIQENVDFDASGWAVVDALGRVTTRLKCKKPGSYYRF